MKKLILALAFLSSRTQAAPPIDPKLDACLTAAPAIAKKMVFTQYAPVSEYRSAGGEIDATTVRIWLEIVQQTRLPFPAPPGTPQQASPTHFVGYLDFDIDACTSPKNTLNLTVVTELGL